MKNIKMIVAALAAGTLCVSAVAPAAAETYGVHDLGTLSGPLVYAWGVNDASTVVGTGVVVPSAAFNAIGWSGGVLQSLGVPGSGNDQSHAYAVNASGVIVGASYSLGRITPQAFRIVSGVPEIIGDWSPRAINEAGLIVGSLPSVNPVGLRFEHACSWNGGVLTDLSTLGGSHSTAIGVDRLGRIVGSAFLAGDTVSHACLWRGGGPVDLGTLGGATSQAYAINSSGHVVGVADNGAGIARAFRFVIDANTGVVVSRLDLGGPAGKNAAAYAVNESGTTVGLADYHAARWDASGFTDLNSVLPPNSGWELHVASAISSGGRIVGWGNHDGQYRAFLLTPPCPADMNGDGSVNTLDVVIFLGRFGLAVSPGSAGDFNGDGAVNTLDLGVLLGGFGCGQ